MTDPVAFFRDRFDWVRVGSGEAFATGYYEPEIRGSRTQQPGYEVPIYAKPDDLARCYGPEGTGAGPSITKDFAFFITRVRDRGRRCQGGTTKLAGRRT